MESVGRTGGRSAGGSGDELIPWSPESMLKSLSSDEARYSRGFLSAHPSVWFPNLAEFWRPLFHSLSADVLLRGFEKGFELPTALARTTVIEADGEPATIGMDRDTFEILAREIVPGCRAAAADVMVEYIERRLLSTLEKSWVGAEPLRLHYLAYDRRRKGTTAGVLGLMLEISGMPCTIWVAVGQRILERLDAEWRMMLLQRQKAKSKSLIADQIHSISVELIELAVPPAMLIDYMRSGTIIDLEIPVSDRVQIRVDDELWGEGQLCQFNGTFAVELAQTEVPARTFPEATTRVRIEIASTELDGQGLIEHSQQSAILITDTAIGARAALIISGEHVGDAVVGELDGRFALRVLPK